MKTNPVIQPYLHAIGNYKYVTESDEHYSRQKAIQSKLEELDRLINKKGIRVKNYSDNKRAMALGLMYHGFAGSMLSPNGPLTTALKNAFVNGTDKQFSDAIYNFYTKVSNGKFN